MLLPGEFVIDDSTPEDHDVIVGQGFGRGWTGRPDEGYGDAASAFPTQLLIPRSEWQARIADKEASGTQLSQIILNAGLPPKNQQSTEFCFANSPVHAVEILRVLQNEPMVILSAASIACPLTNFQNHGGFGKAALQRISDKGIVPAANWPSNAISRQYYTNSILATGTNYRCVDWTSMVPRNIDQLVSLLLLGYPCPIGLNWWSHEVTACDAVWINGAIGIRFRNSWGPGYGANGFATLTGQKMIPDDAICPYTALAA